MAVNPQLFPNGMPVPFVNELFVLARDGVEFEVDKIPGPMNKDIEIVLYMEAFVDVPWVAFDFYIFFGYRGLSLGSPNSLGAVKAKGTVYLSNIRMVFVSIKPVENFIAFDMPMLYVHGEKFNQPIFFCNNISGQVDPVIPENENRALYSTHSFKILFKEGGCGTFIPLFFNLIASVRRYHQQSRAEPRVDPLQAAQTPVDEMMRHAYVDPNDPTRIFLQQPSTESQLRRRTYQSTS